MKRALRHILFLFIFFTCSVSLSAQIDGLMYSMTYGGGNSSAPWGVINRFDPLSNYDTAMVDFTGANGSEPYGNFIQLKNGLLYGMTAYNGVGSPPPDQSGTFIQYNVQTGKDSILYILPVNGNLGELLFGSLCHATNDMLYGLAYYGGANSRGVLFSFNYHTGTYTPLVQLASNTTGSFPTGNLIQVTDSLLYGLTTYNADHGYSGTIFKYNIYTGDTNKVYSFTGGADGGYPRGTLLQVNDSMLYGLTIYGGTSDSGTLFSFNTYTNVETVLVNFTKSEGTYPQEGLMRASDGNLYGTTMYGGVHDSGTLFTYNIASNTETVLHSFGGGDSGGYYPSSDVIQASDGLLYGNTNGKPPYTSGLNNWGTFFSYDINTNTERTLYYYNDTTGAYPYGDFLEAMSASVSVVNNKCSNDSTGSLTIHVRGDRPPLTYSWSNGATTSSISNLKSGIYYDTVWDSRGIAFSFTDTIKPLPMVLTFNVSNPCYGMNNGSASVNVYGGIPPFTYVWSNGETTDTALNLASGTYTCAITDVDGCPAMNTVVITQASPLIIDSIVATKQTYPYYDNGTVKVYVKGGTPPGDKACYLYVWSNGGPDSSIIRNLDSGTYSVCITSCYGCGSTCYDSIKVLTDTKVLTGFSNLARIYPVPSTGLITLNLSGNGFESVEITDALGRPVYKVPLSPQLIDNTMRLDLSTQPGGVYILYVTSQRGVLTKKIIIQK